MPELNQAAVGVAAASHTLKNGCWKLQHANFRIFLGCDVNRDTIRLRKRIRYHFKLFAIKANPSRSGISKMSNVRTDFRH